MFNPLLEDLTVLKDADIESKMTDLNRKYSIALRMGNGQLALQVNLVVESLRFEIQRRQHEATKKMLAKNKDLDGLIKID